MISNKMFIKMSMIDFIILYFVSISQEQLYMMCFFKFQGGLQRESTEMRIYSKLPDIGCRTIPEIVEENSTTPRTPGRPTDLNDRTLRHHRPPPVDIITPRGGCGAPILARPTIHLRQGTNRNLPPLRRHSIPDGGNYERPHNPAPDI